MRTYACTITFVENVKPQTVKVVAPVKSVARQEARKVAADKWAKRNVAMVKATFVPPKPAKKAKKVTVPDAITGLPIAV